VIELSHINVVFTGRSAHRALDDVSLSIAGSSVTVLLGPNGAGKTTLLRVLGRTLLPTTGTYHLAGKDVPTDRKSLRHIVFAQEGDKSLYLRYTGRENVELYLARHGVRPERLAIDRIATTFGLEGWLDKETQLYSKGMRQKLCLIGPLLIPARVVLLDEPTVGLDADSLAALAQTLRALRDEGRALIVATHEIEFARTVFTDVVVMAGGRVLANLDDQAFRSVVVGRRFVITVRDAAIPALPGWVSTRGELGEIVLSRDGAEPADLDAALRRLLQAGVVPTSVSTGEPSFDVVYRRILSNAQSHHGLDQVPVRSVPASPVGAAL
jgi:ABC-2 type transport system ATP-binding protein